MGRIDHSEHREYNRRDNRDRDRDSRDRDRDGRSKEYRKSLRHNKFEIPESVKIDFKNIPLLQRFLTDRGKIVSRRVSGVNAQQQREISRAIKRARTLGLLQVGVISKQ